MKGSISTESYPSHSLVGPERRRLGILRIMQWLRKFPLLLQLGALTLIVISIHLDFVTSNSGCVIWGNYVLPCTRAQYVAWAPILLTWYPYSLMGSSVPIPFPLILAQLTTWQAFYGFSSLLGSATGAKLFAIVSTLFLSFSFLQLSKCFIKNRWAQLAATILLIAGPFQLGLYGYGDYAAFVPLAFAFLSIRLLYFVVNEPGRRWIYFPASFALILLSLQTLQIFELGALLYILFLIVFIFVGRDPLKGRLSKFVSIASRLLLLPLILAPLILPALYSSSVALNPGSSYALPLSTFQTYSASPLAVFLGYGYLWSSAPTLTNNVGFAMVSAASGPAIATLWFWFTTFLVVGTWLGLLLLRVRMGHYLLGVAVLATLLGSGTMGPFAGLNTFFYLHLTGYQVLYASYMWDWVIVVPVTAIALGLLVERLQQAEKTLPRRSVEPSAHSAPRVKVVVSGRLGRPSALWCRKRTKPIVLSVILVLLVGSVTTPYAVGAQYGPVAGGNLVGIQSLSYPSDYSEIPGLIAKLVGASYAGVAVFNPAPEWYLANSTSIYQNYFFYYPTARTPAMPGWGIPPTASNFYSYWVYHQLYMNETKYIGALLAVEGIEYLLVFYGSEPATYLPGLGGANVSQLLRYQSGIVPVVSSNDFAIYRNLYYSAVASPLSNLSIVSGGYSTLNSMAYAGINLTNQGLVFPSDIPLSECPEYLNRTDRVYSESMNGLIGLALACTQQGYSDPLSYIPTGLAVDQGWVSSYADGGTLGLDIVESWPTALAVTYGNNHTLRVPVSMGSCDSGCSLWLPIRVQAQRGGSTLTFMWGNQSWEINTGEGVDGVNNSMVWIQLPINPRDRSGVLEITARGAFNAIGGVYVDSYARLNDWLGTLERSKEVIFATPGEVIGPLQASTPYQAWNYGGLASVQALDGTCLTMQNFATTPLSLNISVPPNSSGWLSLLVRSLTYATLEIGTNRTQLFGFNSGNQNWSSRISMGWIRIPVNPSELAPNGSLSIRLLYGTMFLSEVAYFPFGAFSPPTPIPSLFNLTIGYENLSTAISAFGLSGTANGFGQVNLSGSLSFSTRYPNQELGSVNLSFQHSLSASGWGFTYSIGPGVIVGVDGLLLGGQSRAGLVQYSDTLAAHGVTGTDLTYAQLAFYSGEAVGPTNRSVSFSIEMEPVKIQVMSGFTNIESGASWSVRANTQGYTLTGGPSQMILVRVPFDQSLRTEPAGSAIAPAIGSVGSLVWSSTSTTRVQVEPSSASELLLGGLILGATYGLWIAAEFAWSRRDYFSLRRRRDSNAPREDDDPRFDY